MSTTPITLVCWHCGACKFIDAPHHPRTAFELADWAQNAGMVGYLDMYRGRSLIFCNDDHAREQMTKAGTFRLRPKRALGGTTDAARSET